MKFVNEAGCVVIGAPGSHEVAEALVSKVEELRPFKGAWIRAIEKNASLDLDKVPGYMEDEAIEALNQVAGQQDGVALYFGRKPNTNEYGFWPCTLVMPL